MVCDVIYLFEPRIDKVLGIRVVIIDLFLCDEAAVLELPVHLKHALVHCQKESRPSVDEVDMTPIVRFKPTAVPIAISVLYCDTSKPSHLPLRGNNLQFP